MKLEENADYESKVTAAWRAMKDAGAFFMRHKVALYQMTRIFLGSQCHRAKGVRP